MSMATVLIVIYFVNSKTIMIYNNKEILLYIPPIFYLFILIIHDNIINSKNIEEPINHCMKLKYTLIISIIIILLLCLAK